MGTHASILLVTAAAGIVIIFSCVIVISLFFHVGKPNQVLVFSGRAHKFPDGSTRGYHFVIGGWAFRWPIIEQVASMELTEMRVNVGTRSAYSKGGIAIDLTAVAHVKVSTMPGILDMAIEHFLGQTRDQIQRVAQEVIEGHLRGVIATMTPEEISEDMLTVVSRVADEALSDFEKLGLQLDTLKVITISDSEGYLTSRGARQVAQMKKEAAEAEAGADAFA